jgi:phenylacetate-CoA ligase
VNLYSRILNSVALPWISELTGTDFWRIYQTFRRNPEHTVYSPSAGATLRRLKAIITHAYEHTPFYRERMDGLGLTPDSFKSLDDLRRLPPTTRADIEANFPDRITALSPADKSWREVKTSGTTAGRLTVAQDFRKRDYVRAAGLFALSAATGYQLGFKHLEIPPNICRDKCGESDTKEPNIFDYFLKNLKKGKLTDAEVVSNLRGLVDRQLLYRKEQLLSFDAKGLAQKSARLDWYLNQIDAYSPYTLKALPTYLYLLAIHILETHQKPPNIHGALVPMGGSMTPYMKRVIESAFKRPVRDLYGCAELGDIAAQHGDAQGLRPFANLFYVEVVRQGKPVGDGEVGKVLITDFWNYAMPLIRYEIGDAAVVRYEKRKDGCLAQYLEIQGRVQECLAAEDGTILTSDGITDAILSQPGVLGFQMEVRDDEPIELQVVPKRMQTPHLEEINRVALKLLGGSYKIESRLAPTILPEPSGKYRFVKNRSKTSGQLF